MDINVKISLNKELLDNPNNFKSTNIAAGWVEIEGAFKFPVQVLKNRDNKMFVKYPTKRIDDDNYINVVFPVDKTFRSEIDEKVISELHNEMNKSFNKPEIKEVNITLLPESKSSGNMTIRGYASVLMYGIRVNGFAIKETASGYFVQMPQYRDEHGHYHDQFYGTNKVSQIEISNSILEAYENKLKEIELQKKKENVAEKTPAKQMEYKAPKL